MTHIYLIRHGEAVSNVEPIIAGMDGDTGLTPLGRLQAERLCDRLTATGEIAADVLIASTLPRARQTAEILQPAFGLPIQWDDDVQELRVGEADGMTWEQAIARYGRPNFRTNPYRPLFPGGENWGEFLLRVGTSLNRIATEHAGKTVVVVCHGGVIDGSFLAFQGVNLLMPSTRVELLTHNTSITHWERLDTDGPAMWRLLGYNDNLHTRDIQTPERIGWVRLAFGAGTGSDTPAVPVPTEESPVGE